MDAKMATIAIVRIRELMVSVWGVGLSLTISTRVPVLGVNSSVAMIIVIGLSSSSGL